MSSYTSIFMSSIALHCATEKQQKNIYRIVQCHGMVRLMTGPILLRLSTVKWVWFWSFLIKNEIFYQILIKSQKKSKNTVFYQNFWKIQSLMPRVFSSYPGIPPGKNEKSRKKSKMRSKKWFFRSKSLDLSIFIENEWFYR